MNLKGPLNDVRIMKEALTSRYSFREEDIKVLTEKKPQGIISLGLLKAG